MSMPQVEPSVRRHPSILLVEAEPMLRQTMAKFLERSGFRVIACEDTSGAAAAMSETPVAPSLLVIAARVLDSATVDLAHQLRALAPAVPMLGIADQIGWSSEASLDLPVDLRFLAPPFDLPDVLRAVRSWFPALSPPDLPTRHA